MIRLICPAILLACLPLRAAEIRVEVDGVGCHTRQLAVQKLWSRMASVTSVTIQPRGPSDPANRRVFVIMAAQAPDRPALETALGTRTRFYKVLNVSPVDLPTPALSNSTPPAKVRP
ncbi:MAG: hypothetical protein CFE26_09460 [Verrucomicrobiales bacterium VVV1]|nr:MAG: hypothetical protein CFE26_09460 [Verrucomicrobiales bacterium VVV1]